MAPDKQPDNIKPVGKVSKDGAAFYASPDYLKQISQKDHLYPRIKPLIIVALIILVWWVILFTTYLSGAWHWITETWHSLLTAADKMLD